MKTWLVLALTVLALATSARGESCLAVCPVTADTNIYDGSCNWFTRKNDKKWCTHLFAEDEVCCTTSSSKDCCVLDEGRVAGVAVGIFLAISLSIIACCYCCKCCCFHYRRNQNPPNPPAVMYVTQPVVPMQQMSSPQGTSPQQA